uniref:Integrin, alpha 10 n=1 Tax=Cyprinus carpio TaxID=7962 RepID=A0A8C2FUU5_CYPCA
FSVLGLCECFNIDVKRPRIFSGPEDALFGFSVLQHENNGEKSILVGAPWDGPQNNRKGDIYKCIVGDETNSNCSKVNLGIGSTLCTGICASVTNDMEPKDIIAPTAQRCTTYMDIVIVLDGSNSIYPWYEVQNFLSNILSKFHISPEQMQVGVLQYGEISVHEWSLRDYQTTQDVVEAAKNISRQEGRETRTAYAIQMACTEAFSPDRGAREGATKVMIVVTDGESHDGEDLPDSLAECEKRNITRYAIAVLGHYIRRQQDPETFINEIKYIASDPDEKYFFNVTDEAALNDIVDALGDRIFSLEGTLGYNESAFLMEMSQIGFSTHILDDGILFGMVGAYDWEGGVLKESKAGQLKPSREAFEKEFPLELKNHAAYLGYTVSSVIVGDWRRLYVAGAPRFKHKGKVILFDLTPEGDVIITQALNGEQIGSYFGSEVCVVDVDQDGITDILLIAAPMFLGAGNKETGKVYDGFAPNGTLHSQKKAQDARFGYAMAVAPDLNHDGYADLLVGAPLEDDHQGALYIYHGDEYYIIPQYKQRIPGSSLSSGLQYFGRSLSALLDLDGDELLDLAVGAQGTAVLLKYSMPHYSLVVALMCSCRQQPYVIRSPRRRLAVEVQLQNRLENAYNTSLTLHYSKNLHFSSLSIRVPIECTALSSNSHSCNVSYPVFRSQSKVSL